MKTALLLGTSIVALFAVACGGAIEPEPTPESADEGTANLAESAAPGAPSCTAGETEECDVDGETGMRLCRSVGAWSACSRFESCRPDSPSECPGPGTVYAKCTVRNGAWTIDRSACPEQNNGGSSSTPLVLSFDRAPVRFTHPSGSFDVVGHDVSVETDWVSAATPWLAVDRDGNGSIDDGSELFGSMSRLPDGRRAEHGFAALATLDEDGDGRITGKDSGFASLVLWRDQNQDRRSQPSELTSAAAEGLVSIDLGFHRETRCVGTACEVERATFEFADAAHRGVHTGDIVDVHFRH